MDSASGPTDPDSEGPKINGSAAGMWLWSLEINETEVNKKIPAFYALIIILSLIVAVAFAAVLYLWLEERAHRRGDGRHAHKPVDDESIKDPSYIPPTTRWYSRISGIFSNGRKGGMRDIGSIRRGQGWIQAGTSDEWETDSGEYSNSRALPSVPKEYNPSLNTKRTSATYSIPQRSLVHSFVSDRSSSDVPALPYEDPSAPSNRYSIQSMYSQLLPPSPGPGSYSSHQPNCSISTVSATPVRISTSPPMPSSPVSIEYAISDSHHSSEFHQKPSLHTFGGGTKFIEAL